MQKITDLESWKSQGLYTEVDDNNQPCVSTRWVITKKLIEGKPVIKTRLCVRGFEKIQDFRTDFLCCSRLDIQSVLLVIISNKWHLKSADAKTAFL